MGVVMAVKYVEEGSGRGVLEILGWDRLDRCGGGFVDGARSGGDFMNGVERFGKDGVKDVLIV